ncbi:hypothetical protein GOP47_0016241 [Adiantum capillus-veneris]|uniref:Protein kinase domain-containing protein n=1 Tax=Adiantum capillus-veneris TaxID=13818 RepID=A0A9D4UHA1_ADICA|nr:hypothetical protein GOP47_0016241 [Adiantum capillus-veneris]
MEEEVWEKLATETPLKVEYIQKLWEFWIKERPNYIEFLKCTLPVVMAVSGNFAPFLASGVATTLWEEFQKVDEALRVPSRFSKLSLCDPGRTAEHHLLSARNYSLCSSSTAKSGPPLLFQDKGVEALGCDMCDHHHPAAPKDAIVEELFPKDDWCKVMSATDTKSESKLKTVFDNHREKALELANFVFVKPKKELCDPKIPDFVLVDKEYWESPTTETVGALLFAQSTTESSKSYSTTYAVGEAVAVSQVLLRSASQMRHFIFTGVTNCKNVRWFRVERPGIIGNYNGSRCAETPLVRESLAGMMCCAKENLGICLQRSIVVGRRNIACGGHSISMDVSNLERLQGIKGIPKIVMSDPPSVLLITPVAEQFNLAQLCKNKMYNRVGELVETLECAHNRGIVNRDIRIANILIAEDQFIIVDWGFATSSNEPEEYAGTSHFASTRVLKILEEGHYTLVFEPSDDLVSLVRSLYAFTRLSGMRVHSGVA